MSVWAQAWAFEQDVEPMGAKFVLVALASFADEHGYCYPGHERLGWMTGQTARSVQTHIKALIAAGLLRPGPKPRDSGRNAPAAYYLCAPPERLTRAAMRKPRGPEALDGAAPRPENFSGRETVENPADDRKDFPVVDADDRKVSAPRPETDDATTGKLRGDSIEESVRNPSEEIHTQARARDAEPDFERLWSSYPHPGGDSKHDARIQWHLAVEAGAEPAWIVAAAAAYRAECASRPNTWPKQCATWLRRRCWTDWPRPGPKVSAQPAPAPIEDQARVALGVPTALADRWLAARALLRTQLGESAWRSWIMPLELRAGDGSRVLLAAPTRFIRDHVRTHYERAIAAAFGGLIIDFVVNTGGHHAERSGTGNDRSSS